MIKVLNIISDTNIGGAGRVLLNYAKYRDREKFDMSVILPSGSMLTQPLRQLSAEVYEIDAMADRSFDREAVGMLKELIRKIDPDIVHTHGSLSGRIAARACGKKIVYTRHCAFPVKGYMKHGPGRWANQLLNRRYADRIIAVGQATKENLVESGISEKYIDMMKKNQLTRALRIDKFTATALELVLQEYLSEENAIQNIPVLKMITKSYDETVAEAKTFKRMLQRAKLPAAYEVVDCESQIGGGSLPLERIPSAAVAIHPEKISVPELEERMRHLPVPIIPRTVNDTILLDVRTLDKDTMTLAVKQLKEMDILEETSLL